MATKVFHTSPKDLVVILAEIARVKDDPQLVEALNSSIPSIVFDRDDDQHPVAYYSLHLDVPHTLFARLEVRKDHLETFLEQKCHKACPPRGGQVLQNVVIGATARPLSSIALPTLDEIGRIWGRNTFRIFLSHTNKYKSEVARLKEVLGLHGVSAFVAHEDIIPTREWQDEIELALHSMDVLAALLTPDFHCSNWTDQEIGFALGRGILILPVRLGADPYGFIAKVHGASGTLDSSKDLAAAMIDSLLANDQTGPRLKESLISNLEEAKSYQEAIVISKTIEDNIGWPQNLIDRVEAVLGNRWIAGAYNVPERLKACIARERSAS
jgi:hypothetical protein